LLGKTVFGKKELLILSNLRREGRATITKLSKLTRIPISTIYERLKNNNQGLIKKHTCLIDFSRLGFNTVANILLRTKKEERDQLKQYLLKHHSVNSLYKINSNYDFLLEGVFRNIKDLEEFLEALEDRFTIKSRQVYYIIDDIKREGFLENTELLDLITEK
jgi:DNA-binding Lrp family transcriptional regulator